MFEEVRGRDCFRRRAELISFERTEEQRELQALAHEFAEREPRPIAAECDKSDTFPLELLPKAAALGLTSYAIPEEFGGGGVDAVTAALIAEELLGAAPGSRPASARRCSSATSAPFRDGAAAAPISTAARIGRRPSCRHCLHRAARRLRCPGDHRHRDTWTATRTSFQVRSATSRTAASREVSIVFAKVDGAVTAFLVEQGDPGVAAGRKETKLGLCAPVHGSLVLDGARILADRLLGEEGQGFHIAMDFFEASRPQVAASAVGVARRPTSTRPGTPATVTRSASR